MLLFCELLHPFEEGRMRRSRKTSLRGDYDLVHQPSSSDHGESFVSILLWKDSHETSRMFFKLTSQRMVLRRTKLVLQVQSGLQYDRLYYSKSKEVAPTMRLPNSGSVARVAVERHIDLPTRRDTEVVGATPNAICDSCSHHYFILSCPGPSTRHRTPSATPPHREIARARYD